MLICLPAFLLAGGPQTAAHSMSDVSQCYGHPMKNRIHASIVLATLLHPLFLAGCGRSESVPSAPLNQQQLVESVRSEVAKILKKETSQVDVTKPLAALGADDLDVVEIVMALEEKFKVEIPDSTLGDKPDDVGKTLTVQKLAEIVSKQPKAK